MKYVKMVQLSCPYAHGSYRNRAWFAARACHGLPRKYLVDALESILRDADGGANEWVNWLVQQGVMETPEITDPPVVSTEQLPYVQHPRV